MFLSINRKFSCINSRCSPKIPVDCNLIEHTWNVRSLSTSACGCSFYRAVGAAASMVAASRRVGKQVLLRHSKLHLPQLQAGPVLHVHGGHLFVSSDPQTAGRYDRLLDKGYIYIRAGFSFVMGAACPVSKEKSDNFYISGCNNGYFDLSVVAFVRTNCRTSEYINTTKSISSSLMCNDIISAFQTKTLTLQVNRPPTFCQELIVCGGPPPQKKTRHTHTREI